MLMVVLVVAADIMAVLEVHQRKTIQVVIVLQEVVDHLI